MFEEISEEASATSRNCDGRCKISCALRDHCDPLASECDHLCRCSERSHTVFDLKLWQEALDLCLGVRGRREYQRNDESESEARYGLTSQPNSSDRSRAARMAASTISSRPRS
jgi:hypothetical protein